MGPWCLAALLVTCSTLAAKPAAANDDPLSYKFKVGDVVAYRLDLVWQSNEKTEWFTGFPVAEVKFVDAKGRADLLLVGILRCYSKVKEQSFSHPERNILLGTHLLIDRKAKSLGGRKDENDTSMPFNLQLFLRPSRFLFPALPSEMGRVGEEGGAFLVESRTSQFGLPDAAYTRGVRRFFDEARFSASGIELVVERGFVTDAKPVWKWDFKATYTLDPQRGIVTEMNGVYQVEEVGARRPKVTITLKLLDGEERKKALERCAADWKQLPRHHKPIELLREAVDAERLDRPRSAAELKTGQLVACRHQGRAFKAEVVQVLNPREIRVRLRGSKEELSVGLGSIQLLPSEAPP